MSKSIYEKATDKNIITKQVVINTPTSARLLPITADEKVIDEIQQALNELKCLKKQEKLLELYKRLNNLYEKLYSMELSELSLNSNYYEIEIIKLKQQIKELENE